MGDQSKACELCSGAGGALVYEGERLRVVLVDEPELPGFCRVIWKAHVKEMTDLDPPERALLMDAVWRVEAALRATLQLHKVNLASLGNAVPHLHWHVIPRFADDAHFPAPVWAAPQRKSDPAQLAVRRARLPELKAEIKRQMAASPYAGDSFLAE